MRPYMFVILLGLCLAAATLTETASATEEPAQESQGGGSFSLFMLVRPLGMATLGFVCGTFAVGLFRRKLGRRFLKIHLLLAIVAVILGLTHGIMVFLLYS